MRRKIVFVPLDDRPCNKLFPQYLFGSSEIAFTVFQETGEKKRPAEYEKVRDFLLRECRDAYGLVLSMDMLLYGGLLPSRLHHMRREELKSRAELLRELRQANPALVIYAFQTIMRCPVYSSSDEEPDYYGICGHEIYKSGELWHKQMLGQSLEEDLEAIHKEILPGALEDFLARRECNVAMDEESLSYVRDGTLDFLVFPQDDCSPYGYAALDQQKIYGKVREYGLEEKVAVYPGADEVGMTLTARILNGSKGCVPKVYVKYAAESAREMIPLYEGSPLSGTIRRHLEAAGCQETDSWEEADMILGISAAGIMEEAIVQPFCGPEYDTGRNLEEFTEFLGERKRQGKVVTLADNAYANGGDLRLVRMLNEKNLLMVLDGYAGWNTSANTLGTAIAEGVAALHQGRTAAHKNFMAERYLEDAGYCSVVRRSVSQAVEEKGMEKTCLHEKQGEFSRLAETELRAFAEDYLSAAADRIRIVYLAMPWERMFEVDLRAEYRE
ncbi:MAG: DUF4127 family protein [Butyrivibrio sp.]|nr:DUF4127 family protein [Butyrivibrio sp.]